MWGPLLQVHHRKVQGDVCNRCSQHPDAWISRLVQGLPLVHRASQILYCLLLLAFFIRKGPLFLDESVESLLDDQRNRSIVLFPLRFVTVFLVSVNCEHLIWLDLRIASERTRARCPWTCRR